jgi:hypothetical protein
MAQKLVTGVLLFIASLVFAAYTLVWWTERQILNSDNWVSYSSQLPKNPEVASALSDKLTNQIFANVPVEERVAEALPPRAGFLAAPLTSQIQNRTTDLVTRAIESDTFQSVWTGANRLAIDRVLNQARQDNSSASERISEKFNVNLASIQPLIEERLDKDSPISPALKEGGEKIYGVTTDLKVAREHIRDFVRTTDSLYVALPAVFAASFLGMLAFASDRRRSLITLAMIAILLLLIELVAIRYGRQQILSRVENSQYIPAVSHIFDSLLSSLRQMIGWLIAFWALVSVFALAAGNSGWAVAVRKTLRIYDLSSNRAVAWFRRVRTSIAQYRFMIWGVIVVLVLIYLAFIGSVTTLAIVNSMLIGLSLVFLVQILSDSRVTPAVQSVSKRTKKT